MSGMSCSKMTCRSLSSVRRMFNKSGKKTNSLNALFIFQVWININLLQFYIEWFILPSNRFPSMSSKSNKIFICLSLILSFTFFISLVKFSKLTTYSYSFLMYSVVLKSAISGRFLSGNLIKSNASFILFLLSSSDSLTSS